MMLDHIAVSATALEKKPEARRLAAHLGLAFIEDPHSASAKQYAYLLVFTTDYLGLQKTTERKFAPFHIDFLSGKMRYRSQQAGLRKELLARAMGCSPRNNPLIIDATAGLGRDSFILATLGFTITLIERSPILHALLEDGLKRAKSEIKTAPIVQRMHLICADAIAWLKATAFAAKPQVIYLDPMFPERQKSASVKKEMTILQHLLGKDEDANDLFATALTCTGRRVVVKRPRLAANIAKQVPDFSMAGKSSRFDVYLAYDPT